MDSTLALPRVKIGFGLCLLGLVVAASSVIPGVIGPGQLPWPIFVGSAIYFPGSFLAFFSTRGMERRRMLNYLRFIRLGFLAIVVILISFVAR